MMSRRKPDPAADARACRCLLCGATTVRRGDTLILIHADTCPKRES